MPNIYYEPEDFNLKIVSSIELTDEAHTFDILVVWQHLETEQLYWMRDSGCSCPTPFEDYVSVESLNRFEINSVRAEVLREMANGNVSAETVAQFLDNLALRGIR